MNIQEFVNKQSKLVTKKSTTRVAKLDLTGKNNRGEIKLHIVPDTTGLPMLTTKDVFRVGQTETYTYQDEVRTKYPVYIIPNSSNYDIVNGAVMPTDMQLKKLDKLYGLLSKYADLTATYRDGKKVDPILDSKSTETKLWTKYIGTYTKFWAKIAEIKPDNPDPKAKQPDFSKITMVTHSSANFVKAFNKWATPDSDSEISVDDQLAKIEGAISNEQAQSARCVKITTNRGASIGYDVEFKNIKPENASVDITEEDATEATPLLSEDWDYTVFDDEKVDTLIERLEKYMSDVDLTDTENQPDDEDEDEEENKEDNPFEDDEE